MSDAATAKRNVMPSGFSTARPRRTLVNLEQRLALDNGTVVREGVERLHEERLVAAFDVDITDRAETHPPAGIELVEQPLVDAVEGQFLLEGPEDFGVDRFKLKVDLVLNLALVGRFFCPSPSDRTRQDSSLARQRRGRGSCDFRQDEVSTR